MSNIRTISIVTGVLLLAADVAGVASVAVLGSALDGRDILGGVAANQNAVALSAALVAIMGLACAGIGIATYPVLRRVSSGLAIGSVAFRTAEATMFLLTACVLVALGVLAGEVQAGSVKAAAADPAGDLLRALHSATGVLAALPFTLGAFLYYVAFYIGRLTPRWLAAWGVAAIAIYFATALGAIVTRTDFDSLSALLMPLALQELVLAVYLIARGFRESADVVVEPTQARTGVAAAAAG